ncbi:putative aldo-keto reductase 1 [Vitis vinifera]|uniref:Putative aldo-keto reductase 1 n=1 Tax=Vitis vinifera TaxID=29760 RepID=A0A438DS67_VITVI|nr:putative aldo-keto reductase 1 [Vitis vinifera]
MAELQMVSKLGLGCRGLSGGYNNPVPDDVGIAIIKHAFSKGITFFDTADAYGAQANEVLIGKLQGSGLIWRKVDCSNGKMENAERYRILKALKELPREKIQLATKFGHAGFDPATGLIVNGTLSMFAPVMGELKKLVEEEKIKYIGLSEASPDTIRRAYAVHPVTALQMEWSLWTRDIEEEIVPLCRELGIGIVPYSPLGRGFFGGKAVDENVPANSFLMHPAQLALAWVLCRGDNVAPIPGTTKIKNLDDNIGSLRLNLTKEDLEEISDAVPLTEVAGARAPDVLTSTLWQFANTRARDWAMLLDVVCFAMIVM